MARRFSQTFDNFFRGIFQRRSPRSQDPAYLNEALNMACVGGMLVSRPGARPFNGVEFADTVRGHGWHVRPDGTRELLVAAGAAFQRCVLGGDPIDMPLTSLPLYAQTRVEQEKVHFLALSGGTNTTFIYDGVNENLKWDGLQLTKMGLPIGPTPPVPTAAFGAITPGTRDYVATLVSLYHESDVSVVARRVTNTTPKQHTFASPSQTQDGTGSAATIAAAAAANQYDDPQAVMWRLWRTVGGGAAYKFIGEADIGVAIVDNKTDAVLDGEDPPEQLVNGPPQAPIVAMVEHRGQLVAAMSDDPSILRFSNYDADYMVPEGWPRNFIQPVSHGDGDVITALRSFFDWCVIFKNNSSHAITGDAFADYKIIPVFAGGTRMGVGCAFPGSILQTDNAVFFAARDGIYRIDRAGDLTAKRISASIDDLYAAANFSLGSASFHDRKRRLIAFMAHG